ncbi:MAG: hypothetical protein K0S65_1575 [Labilithrix sp.]|nr:hypothetical protein [Labilithrix sp.]
MSPVLSARSALLAAALVLSATAARADEPVPASSLRYTNTLGAQMNPRALGDDVRIRYRHRLYAGEGTLFEQNFVGAFGGVALGAGVLRPIVGLELQPLSALTLGVSYNPMLYLGAFGLAQSYPSPKSDYGSGAIAAPADGPGGSYALFVHQVTLHGSLQGKAGALVFRNAVRATYFHADPHEGDRVLYDPSFDVAVYRRGWALQNDSDAGIVFNKHLVAGLRHTLVVTWYPSGAFASGEPTETHDSPTSRVGPFASYTFFERRGGTVDSASLSSVVQWYVAHRYRTGEASPAALPLAGLAFTVSGDL